MVTFVLIKIYTNNYIWFDASGIITLQLALTKSPTGRHLLMNDCEGLSTPERQLLNTVNGSRTRKQLLAIIGQDADVLVNQMITEGLLIEYPLLPSELIPDPASSQWADTQGVLPQDDPAAQPAVRLEILTKQHGMRAAVTTKISTVLKNVSEFRGRRSIVATKMYTIDMLKLVLSTTSATHISAIQCSANANEMMVHVMSAMQYLQTYSSPNYVAKVMCHLQEVVPVEYVEQIKLMIFNALMAEEKQR